MFELLAMALEEVPKHIQESAFINDLKLDIKANVRMMKPDGLREIMKFAQWVEERNLWSWFGERGGGGQKSPNLELGDPLDTSIWYSRGRRKLWPTCLLAHTQLFPQSNLWARVG